MPNETLAKHLFHCKSLLLLSPSLLVLYSFLQYTFHVGFSIWKYKLKPKVLFVNSRESRHNDFHISSQQQMCMRCFYSLNNLTQNIGPLFPALNFLLEGFLCLLLMVGPQFYGCPEKKLFVSSFESILMYVCTPHFCSYAIYFLAPFNLAHKMADSSPSPVQIVWLFTIFSFN